MHKPDKLEVPSNLLAVNELASHCIREHYSRHGKLNILEAGCGAHWDLEPAGVELVLTGVDISPEALEKRTDLDEAILGDLRSLSLPEDRFDVIYNSYVLEHVQGAETVLDNFVKWLKPGGIIILKMPDRNSAFGFITRMTPYWFHVLYYRYVHGKRNAGKPGHSPFPTFYDGVVSRKGIHEFCLTRGLAIRAEYGTPTFIPQHRVFHRLIEAVPMKMTELLSFGSLSSSHLGLLYVLQKT